MSDESIPEQFGDEATPVIRHSRDLVVYEGAWEQDYHFLDYDFAPAPFTARHYLDERSVAILEADGGAVTTIDDVPAPVRRYLQYRYDELQVMAGTGRKTIWTRDGAGVAA